MEEQSREEELKFAKLLRELRETALAQGSVVSKEQVEEQFVEMGFQTSQLELVYDYLKKSGIGVDSVLDANGTFSSEDRNYINLYLKELEELSSCSQGEKEAYLISAISGDRSSYDKLVEAFLPQVVDIAKLYVGQGVLLEDLIGEGNVALAVTMDMLVSQENPKDAEAAITQMIMNAMEELVNDTLQEKNIANNMANKANLIMEKARQMSEELLRKVTVEELSKETGLSIKSIQEAIRITAGKIEYIEGKAEDGE